MSDQTPPPGPAEPTRPVDQGTSESTPPPPPPASDLPQQPGQPVPPPPPAKKSKKGLLIGLVAGLVVLALIAGGVAAFALGAFKSGPDKHSIATPATAGGLNRDAAKEKQLQQQLDAAEQQFKTQAKNVSYTKSGVYQQGDSKKGPTGALVFLGAKLSKMQSPTAFVNAFSKQAGTNGFKISKIAAGDAGGKAVCAEQSQGQKVAICAWATNDTMGELVPTVPGYDSKQLSKILVAMRSDIEKTQ